MPRRLSAAAIACLAAVSLGQRADPPAPLDPAHAVTQFRKAYFKRPFVESMEVYVVTPSERKRETVVIRGSIKGELRLELGELTLWTDGPRLLAVNRLNAGVYFEGVLEGPDRAAALTKLLPPLPVPQIGLALQPVTTAADAWGVSPLCSPLHWTRALAGQHAGRPGVELVASGETCSAGVIGVGDPPALVEVESRTQHDGITTTLRADITRLDEPVGRIDADLRARTRVASLTELTAMVGDVRPGLALPELIIEPLQRAERPAKAAFVPAGMAGVLVLMRDAAPEIEASVNACRAMVPPARPGAAPVWFRVVGVAPLGDAKQRSSLTQVLGRVDAGAAGVSYSARSTIERFAPGKAACAVVVDASGLVTAVIELPAAGGVDRLKAALDALKKSPTP